MIYFKRPFIFFDRKTNINNIKMYTNTLILIPVTLLIMIGFSKCLNNNSFNYICMSKRDKNFIEYEFNKKSI